MRQQTTRLVCVFALLVGGMLAARHFLLPKTFGERGHYRAAAVTQIEKQPIRYAGREACAMCHSDVAAAQKGGRHQNVSCEVCHGPAADHAEAPTDHKPARLRERGFCPLCHGYDPSRPTGFPQIDPVAHNAPKACISCHNPHRPEPPHVPEDCTACHGEIARMKAVSHHAQLSCTRCHKTAVKHKVTPREARPEKPAHREFCGECHAQGPPAPKDVPRVDMATHGGRYLCWQCHYPHYPEVD